jgi:hypothetical protein
MSKYEDMEDALRVGQREESRRKCRCQDTGRNLHFWLFQGGLETVMEEGLDALLRLSSGLDMEKLDALQQASAT